MPSAGQTIDGQTDPHGAAEVQDDREDHYAVKDVQSEGLTSIKGTLPFNSDANSTVTAISNSGHNSKVISALTPILFPRQMTVGN